MKEVADGERERGRPARALEGRRSSRTPRTLNHLDNANRTVDYVVVAFRSERHLGPCLDAIEADRPGNASVIVVDNASPDASAQVAKHHRSRPRMLVSPQNLGFGGACNLALEASTAELLFFVNPDARLIRGTTTKLGAVMEVDPWVAAVGPRIDDPSGNLKAASAGFEPSLRSVLGHFLFMSRLPGVGRWFAPLQLPERSAPQEVDWISGAALMVRTDAFRSVGGFDPSIFLYMEDVDLCRRLRATGWTIRYEPSVAVEHDLGGSQGSEQPAQWFAAFYGYLARRHGNAYARVASGLAAVGLCLRAAALALSKPTHARRLARAAAAAASLALRLAPLPEAIDS